MSDDPGSLSNLRDIVTPDPAPWWPLAPGWYVVIAIAVVALVYLVIKAWKQWKANAYRRAALAILKDAADASEIATILKRTALAAYPRSEVASLTGDAWCNWLEENGPGPIDEPARKSLARSVFAKGNIDLEAMRGYAISWVNQHRVEAVTTKGEAAC